MTLIVTSEDPSLAQDNTLLQGVSFGPSRRLPSLLGAHGPRNTLALVGNITDDPMDAARGGESFQSDSEKKKKKSPDGNIPPKGFRNDT